MNHDDDVAMAGEWDRVAGVAVLLPDLIQWRWTKGLTVLDLSDRSAGSEGPGGHRLDRRTATVALGMNERVRERGTSEGEEADLGLARVWQGRVALSAGEMMGRRVMAGAWPSRPRVAGRRPPPLYEQRRKERG